MISPKSIEEVRNAARIEEVLGEFLELRRAGVNLKGPCPFHDEKTPSFVVSPAKGIYKCFGCGKAGDSVRFLMDHEKLSYPEAIRWIANKYNIELDETKVSDEVREEFQKQESLYIINDFAQKHFHDYMMNTNEGRLIGLAYFKERGFIEKTILQWGLGYAPADRSFLFKGLSSKKYNLEYAHELGLLKNNRDFFHARVMFPIRNLSGKIIGFGGRTLSSEKKIPKYLNSPESDIYNKRKTLFGLYFAKTEIRKKDVCYLVEGYTDVLSLHQNGIENVVASSGTSLTADQVRLIKRFTENITVIFDGDNAGIKAALRGLDIILEQDVNVRLLLLPEGEDPDSYCRQVGSTAFQEYIQRESKDFILFKIDLLLKEAGDDPIRRSQVVKDIVQSIAKIQDPLKRTEYVKACSRLLEISEGVIQREANKLIKEDLKKNRSTYGSSSFRSEEEWEKKETEKKHNEPSVQAMFSDEFQERDVIRILMTLGDKLIDEQNNGNVGAFLYSNLHGILDTFENEVYAEILRKIPSMIEETENLSPEYFLGHQEEKIRELAIEFNAEKFTYANWKSRGIELQTQSMPEENYIKDSLQAILRLKSKKLQSILEKNQEQIVKLSEENSAELDIRLKAYQKLKEDLAQLNKMLGTVVLK